MTRLPFRRSENPPGVTRGGGLFRARGKGRCSGQGSYSVVPFLTPPKPLQEGLRKAESAEADAAADVTPWRAMQKRWWEVVRGMR